DPRRARGVLPHPAKSRSRPAGNERDLRADRRQPASPRGPRMGARRLTPGRPADDRRGHRTMNRRYLITGAQGFVGRYLTARILELEKSAQVLGIGRSKKLDGFFSHAISIDGEERRAPLPGHLLRNLDGRYRYQQLSLLETKRLEEVIRELQPHCIVHLARSEEHTSELQSLRHLVCRLLLDKKKTEGAAPLPLPRRRTSVPPTALSAPRWMRLARDNSPEHLAHLQPPPAVAHDTPGPHPHQR